MKKKLFFSLVFLVIMVLVMRYQGQVLITPVSKMGILDLEFARTGERLQQLRLFWNLEDVRVNIYLDFLFIIAYAGFFVVVCNWIQSTKNLKHWGQTFTGVAIAAGLFDVCENFLMLLVLNGRFDPIVLQVVFYCAAIKFILAAGVIIFIIISIFIPGKKLLTQ